MENYLQNILISSRDLNEEKEYWLKKLSGDIVFSKFLNDTKKITEQNNRTKNTFYFSFPEETSFNIINCSNNSDYRIYMLLLSSVKYILYLYNKIPDVIVGMPQIKKGSLNERTYIQLLRTNISLNEDDTFKDMLLRIQETVNCAIKYKNIHYTSILRHLKSKDYNLISEMIPDVIVAMKNIHKEFYSDVNFFLNFERVDNIIKLEFTYNDDLYSSDAAKRVAEYMVQFLNSTIKNPEIKISEIEILSPKYKKLILDDFNNTTEIYDKDKTVTQLFEQQVCCNPHSIALVYKDKSMTYEQLNKKSNRLAHTLRQKGVKKGEIIGLMVGRSMEIIIGILGILKSGAAYLPIDTQYPVNRIEYMLKCSKSRILLSDNKNKSYIEFGGEVININDDEVYSYDDTNLENLNKSNDTFYVIFTSGSTGKPKGIEMKYHSISNFILGASKAIKFDTTKSIICLSSVAFDIFIVETLLPLVKGAKVVIADENEQIDSRSLKTLIQKNCVNILQVTPSRMRLILSTLKNEQVLKEIKQFVICGEVFTKDLCNELTNITDEHIYNMYGPTETCIWSTMGEMLPDEIINIGKPMANTYIYILDKNRHLVPIGAEGEIWIGGEGLARGYLYNEELTKEKFIKNPFHNRDVRIYKTGDMGRWLSDGSIECLGRIDDQMKIRGFRIEPGEIEEHLIQYPGIKAALITDQEGNNGIKFLCAYIVFESDLSVNALRTYLSSVLPQFMIPDYFFKIDNIPLTFNGKLDKKILPSLLTEALTDKEYLPPIGEKEIKIHKVWCDVLGLKRISVNESFFAVGGDSIKALQVFIKLSMDFELSVNDIFVKQTIRKLAKHITLRLVDYKSILEKIKKLSKYDIQISSVESESILSSIESYKNLIKKYHDIDVTEKNSFKNIFILGSTGFLGVCILREILTVMASNVYLLVRGKDLEDSQKRLNEKLKFYFGDNLYNQYKERITILNGDIAKNKFGLKEEVYEKMSENVDCIINAASNVKDYGSYDDFYEINVEGTKKVIEFALSGNKKCIQHISTIGIAYENIPNRKKYIFTEYDCNIGQELNNFYLNTKVEAEEILNSFEKELNINIFRVGNLILDSKTGKFQENIKDNAFYSIIKSFIKISKIPDINKDIKYYNLTSADFASKAIIELMKTKKLSNETLHIYNPNFVGLVEISKYINQMNYEIEIIDIVKFFDYMINNFDNESLRPYIESIVIHSGLIDIFEKTQIELRSDKTLILLDKLNFTWPNDTYELFKQMINYCEKVNYL